MKNKDLIGKKMYPFDIPVGCCYLVDKTYPNMVVSNKKGIIIVIVKEESLKISIHSNSPSDWVEKFPVITPHDFKNMTVGYEEDDDEE